MTDVDALVVGGAAAGLSAALVLGRARVDALVVDAGEPSNRVAHHIGGLLGQPDTSPAELYETGREQLAELPTVELRAGVVEAISGEAGAFSATLAGGDTVAAQRVLFAGGVDYRLPDVPGLAELWGDTAFMCPYCHGWELRDRRIGVLGDTGLDHRLPLLRAWSEDLVVLGDDRPVAGVAPGVVRFADGGELEVGALHVAARMHARDALAAGLGVETTDDARGSGFITADRFGATSVPGVFAAGDSVGAGNVGLSIGQGGMAAVGLHRSLLFGA